jgi:hypothetical protein
MNKSKKSPLFTTSRSVGGVKARHAYKIRKIEKMSPWPHRREFHYFNDFYERRLL